MGTKHGINECMDVVNYAEALVAQLHAKKADDGKIDGAEIAGALTTTAPAGIKAIWGAGDIPAELGDLSDEEKEKLVNKAMPVLINLVKLFVPVA